MKLKFFLSVLLRLRNLAVLFTMMGAGALFLNGQIIPIEGNQLNIVVPTVVAAIYIGLVYETMSSKNFNEYFMHKYKIGTIRELNRECIRLANEARIHTNAVYLKKLQKVMADREEILNSLSRGGRSTLKEQIVIQTLNLVISYEKLLTNFCMRSRELSTINVSELIERINSNTRKLNFVKNSGAAEDIKKVIEMDERVILKLKEEKSELERIGAKLDFIESTVNSFKRQILSSIESEDMLVKLDSVVNEAVALDSVLEERRKDQVNLRY